jgi:hypothetical protein
MSDQHAALGAPIYWKNKHGALMRRQRFAPSRLDEHGRCCGRKPISYKRPSPYFVCDRCGRHYGPDGVQRASWLFKSVEGALIETRPENEELLRVLDGLIELSEPPVEE